MSKNQNNEHQVIYFNLRGLNFELLHNNTAEDNLVRWW